MAAGRSTSCRAMFWMARLLELHQVEERLAGLPAIEPSNALLGSVMSRVTQPRPVEILPARQLLVGMFRYPVMFVGALILAVAYLVPGAGQSWLPDLWPSVPALQFVRLPTYLLQHPPWAIVLAGFAALLILMGLALPEPPVRRSI